MPSTLHPQIKAAILRATAESNYPRGDIPTIAHRFGLTVEDVKHLIDLNGYPSAELMRRSADRFDREAATHSDDAEHDQPDVDVSAGHTGEHEPAVAPPSVHANNKTPTTAVPLGELMRWARHDVNRVDVTKAANAVVRATDRLRALHHRVTTAQAARADIERLEEELRAARARAGHRSRRPATQTTTPAAAGDHPCGVGDCTRTFTTGQGVALHRRRAHSQEA